MTLFKKSLFISTLLTSFLFTACGQEQPAQTVNTTVPVVAENTVNTEKVTPELTANDFKTEGMKITEGTDYKKVATPQPLQIPNKLEVLEFFWYGCPHCKNVDPIVQAWEKTTPSDVNFIKAHVSWGKPLDSHQKIFYTLKSLKKNKEFDGKVFKAIHTEGLGLDKPELISEFMDKNGINKAEWNAAYNSFSVSTDIAKSDALFKAYGLQGVPYFIINGKYVVGGESAQTMKIINKLLEMERTAKK